MADIQAKIAEVRTKFQGKYNGSILDDTYDDRDVKRIKTDDAYMKTILNSYRIKGDVGKAVEQLNTICLFRAKTKINDMKESDLNQEVFARNGVFFKNVDKDGYKILHFKVAKQKKGKDVEEGKQIINYLINQHYKDNPESPVVFMFDFTDAGVSNMDLDVTKYITELNKVYPAIMAYNLMFKMGAALEVVWKIIKGWLDAEQSKKTYFVTRSNVQDYIPLEQLEPHMIKDDKK